MRDLAQKLLAACQTASGAHVHEAVLVNEKLRIFLTKFIGADGFAALLRRALVLARAEVPALENVTIGPDCCLEGFERHAADSGRNAESDEAAAAITAHLLALLVNFVGEPFTMRLVREAYPETSLGTGDQLHEPKAD